MTSDIFSLDLEKYRILAQKGRFFQGSRHGKAVVIFQGIQGFPGPVGTMLN
jgi:hypothetical protein